MFPIWLLLGIVMVLTGVFNKQIGRFLGIRSMSEVFVIPNLKRSSQIVEKMGKWLTIVLGTSFLAYGLGTLLPQDISYKISFFLLGLSGLMILAILGITIANWRAK
jgi:hypothetical protein